MSFMKSLKGLADDFKDLMGDKDKEKDKQQGKNESDRGASDSYYQQGPVHNQPQHTQSQYPPQQQSYNQSQYPPQQQNYTQSQYPPQQPHYGGPPPQSYGAPPSGPNLPPGWVQQWDQNSQRYYYIEQATGRSQWEPPITSPPVGEHSRAFGSGPPAQHGYPGGYGQGHSQGYDQHGYSQQSYASHPGGENFPVEAEKKKDKEGKKKKDSGKGGLIAAGAGGLLVGGLAGAALAGDSSDDEKYTHAAPAAGYGAPPAGYGAPPAGYQDPYGAPPPGDPQALEHNSDVSSSQRESLEEARHEYESAQRAAADSDASSSDIEAAEEAREEYQSEIESAEEEADDD